MKNMNGAYDCPMNALTLPYECPINSPLCPIGALAHVKMGMLSL